MNRVLLIAAACLFLCAGAVPAGDLESHLMRNADVSGDTIVFTYEGDLWLVSSAGGDARRITRDAGVERYAHFNPDGSLIAFTASYDGGSDVYVMDARGGEPRRLTWHPSRDRVLGWNATGSRVLFRSSRVSAPRGFGREELYMVALEGGMPVRLPVDRAGLAALSPDGLQLAYNRISREDRTWKRHQGGTAQDIWVGSLAAGDFHRATDWVGSDNYPMWDESGLYFLSDRTAGTMNLYRLDPQTFEVTALTSYTDYDIKYPSIGTGKIVFQYAESLHLLDLESAEVTPVPVRLRSDLTKVRTERVDASKNVQSFRVSPSGDKLILSARGEILEIPAEPEDGEPRNLSRRSASREKNAVWSPDGETVAFVSDRSGEEEIWLIDPAAGRQWLQLTSGRKGFLTQHSWSPDGKYLLYSDKTMALNLLDVASQQQKTIAQGEYDDAWERWGIQDYVFSPDSKWIAYTKLERSLYESIFLFSIESGETQRLSSWMTNDWSPSFSPDGRYLYFLSGRSLTPTMGAIDQNHVFLDVVQPYLVLLQDGMPSPFAPKYARVKASVIDEEDGGASEGDESDLPSIDIEGVEARILAVPGVAPGNYFRLEGSADGFFYLAKTEREFLKYQAVSDTTGGHLDLHHYTLDGETDETFLSGIGNYHLSSDGHKLVYRSGSRFGIIPSGKAAKVGDGLVDLSRVKIKVNRQEEFLQIFNEAWRVQRDWFYDPGMHGVDWARIGEKYRRFVPDCGNRADLNYLIGEMIGELNIGHTYIHGGELGPAAARVPVGLLGASFDQPEGSAFHRIARIVPGDASNPRWRSPLEEFGCDIEEGDYLIAIDGEPVPSSANIYSFLEDKVGRGVELSYHDEPVAEGAATCVITPLGSESPLRYHAWVEGNRRKVDQASGGKIGYLHLPNMMEPGLIQFARYWYPQYFKQGMIIDERYNGGGFVGDMIVDRLERKVWSLTQPREGKQLRDPERVFHGHLAVLINEDTGSNGEFFAQTIKVRGLAPVIGMRTWGGVIGIEPHQTLVDGAVTTPPQFGLVGLDGTWPVEGHGVEPTVVVDNPPSEALAGRDPQLEYAVELLLRTIEDDPMELPETPVYPVKAKH